MTSAKTRIFAHLAELARVLGHAYRLEILEYVAQGEQSVERLAQLTSLSIANASQHLQQLRRGGFVTARRDGKRVLYRLSDGPALALLTALRYYGEHSQAQIRAIIADYFERLDQLEPISRDELAARIMEGSVTLLDVRPPDEFAQGRLPSAINMPLSELEARLAELPTDREIVAYCRGPYCVLSFEAVAALRARGYAVRRVQDGYPEWKASGLPIVKDAPPMSPSDEH